MKHVGFAAVVLLVGCVLGIATLGAAQGEDKERAELAKTMSTATVSLQQGLSTSASAGQPISAKFEIDEGKLQLSVYTKMGDGFSEVVIDPATGKIAKTEAITKGEDLAAAKAQAEALAKAKRYLRAAVDAAVKSNPGYRAVSIYPELKDGHPTAAVTLVKGDDWKTVSEKLD